MYRAARHAQSSFENAGNPGRGIQIRRLDGEAVRRQPLFDHLGELLHAAAFVIVNDLQNTHQNSR